MDPNLILFLILAICMFGGFISLLIFLRKRAEKQEIDLFKKLSQRLGFSYCEGDAINLQNKIAFLGSDFAKSPVNPLKRVVYGVEGENSVYLFNRNGPVVGSGKNSVIPSWSVCLIETRRSFGFEAVIFHRSSSAGFLELKEYKIALERLREVEVDKPEFAKPQPNRFGITFIGDKYILKTNDLTKCQKAVEKGMIDIFLKYKQNFNVMGMNMMMAVHIKDNLLAVYTDHPSASLNKVEQFEHLYLFAKEIKEVLI